MSEQVTNVTVTAISEDLANGLLRYLEDRPIKEAGGLYGRLLQEGQTLTADLHRQFAERDAKIAELEKREAELEAEVNKRKYYVPQEG